MDVPRPNLPKQSTLGGAIRGIALATLALGLLSPDTYAQDPSWRTVPVPANLAQASYRSLTFPAPDVGIAVGVSGVIARSLDSGLTWTRISWGADTTTLHGVAFLGARNGIAVGGAGTVLRSSDNGATWTKVTSIPTMEPLFGVDFQDSNTAWACGASGTLLRSVDKGVTWTAFVHGLGQAHLKSISFSKRMSGTLRNGALVGDSGFLAYTPDWGGSWVRSSIDDPRKQLDFHRVVFGADPTIAMVVGYPASVWRSLDGGRNWVTSTWNTSSNRFQGVAEGRFGECMVVGDGGLLRRATSLAAAWNLQVKITSQDLAAVAFSNGTIPVIMGDSGLIMRRDGPSTGIVRDGEKPYHASNDARGNRGTAGYPGSGSKSGASPWSIRFPVGAEKAGADVDANGKLRTLGPVKK